VFKFLEKLFYKLYLYIYMIHLYYEIMKFVTFWLTNLILKFSFS